MFSVGTDAITKSHNLIFQFWVHCLSGRRRAFTLKSANILGTEKELAVKIALLNLVHIGDVKLSFGPRTQTHHGPVLQGLTTDSTRTDQELGDIGKFVLVFLAEHRNLTIVAGAKRLAALFRSSDR